MARLQAPNNLSVQETDDKPLDRALGEKDANRLLFVVTSHVFQAKLYFWGSDHP